MRAEPTGVAHSPVDHFNRLSKECGVIKKEVEYLADLSARAKRVTELSPDEFLGELRQLFGGTARSIARGKQEVIQTIVSHELHRAFQLIAQRLSVTVLPLHASDLHTSGSPVENNRESGGKKINEAYEAFNTIAKLIKKGLNADNLQRVIDKIDRLETSLKALTSPIPVQTKQVATVSVAHSSFPETDVLLAHDLNIKPDDLLSLRSRFPACDSIIEVFKKYQIPLPLLSARLEASPSDLSEESLATWGESIRSFDQSLSTFERITRQFSPEEHPEKFATIERVRERSERLCACRALPDWEFYVRCHSTIIKVTETLRLQPELSAHAMGLAIDLVSHAEEVSACFQGRPSRLRQLKQGRDYIFEWRIAHKDLFQPPTLELPPDFPAGLDITVLRSISRREALSKDAPFSQKFGLGTESLKHWRRARLMLIAFAENSDNLEQSLAPHDDKSVSKRPQIDSGKYSRHVNQIIGNLDHIRRMALEEQVDRKARSKLLSLLGTVAKQLEAPVLKNMSGHSQGELTKIVQAFKAPAWLTWDAGGFSLCSAYANKVQELLERERSEASL